MSREEAEPTTDELFAMAYVDDELDREARHAFEARLASEPALRREVAALRKLEVLARNAAPPEPMDYAMGALERELLQRAGWHVGWTVLTIALLGLLGWACFAVATGELPLLGKLLILCILGSLVLLFGLTLRARLKTLAYDPYTEIQR